MKNVRMLNVLVLLFMGMMMILSGCNYNRVEGQPDNKTKTLNGKTIAISYLSGENEYFVLLAETIRKKAENEGYHIVICDGQRDNERQTQQIRDFIEKKVCAIILVPCDSMAIGTAIQEANAANVPVFTVDVAVMDPLAHIVCHVATDNYGGGKNAALELIQAVKYKGKLAIVDDPALESVQLRTRGFQEVVACQNQLGAQVEIVSTLPGYGQREQSRLTMLEILKDHPDLSGVFAINAPTCLGVIAALTETGKSAQVKIVSFDGNEKTKKMVDEGIISADIIQLPEEMGNLVFDYVHQYLKGKMIVSQTLFAAPAYKKGGM